MCVKRKSIILFLAVEATYCSRKMSMLLFFKTDYSELNWRRKTTCTYMCALQQERIGTTSFCIAFGTSGRELRIFRLYRDVLVQAPCRTLAPTALK